jgi:hypothetical protein
MGGCIERRNCQRKQVLTISYQLSAISYQLSAISHQLSAISYQLSVLLAGISDLGHQH